MTYRRHRPLRRPAGPRAAAGLLREFNEAGVLIAADVHVALRLGRLAGEPTDEAVLLAAALAVRAPAPRPCVHRPGHHPRHGDHRCRGEPVDLHALPWPGRWLERL